MDIACITAIITAVIAVAGVAGTIVNYTVIKPTQASNAGLQESIADLRALISEIRRDLRTNTDKVQDHEVRISVLEHAHDA